MMAATASRPAAFSTLGALALVAGGFTLFVAMLWLIGSDADFAGERGQGQAHAASNGLNGYSGLVRLTEAAGYSIERSRNPAGLETYGLLVLSPGFIGDGKEVGKIIRERRFRGPTLVIMPKWWTSQPGPNLPPQVRGKFKKGWVTLGFAQPSEWPEVLPTGYHFRHRAFPRPVADAIEVVPDRQPGQSSARPEPASPPASPSPLPPARWRGLGLEGVMPTGVTLHAETGKGAEPLITDDGGRVLAFATGLAGREGPRTRAEQNADIYTPRVQPVVFLVDPDLANNYGLADPQRAAAAIALVDELAAADDIEHVVFDMTLAGFGASENLLTLAFRPPFLAATLSLLIVLLIVGWRAFRRFGPAATDGGPGIAFGKRQLVANAASLILRARRFRLLGRPYAALSARRLAERLGLVRPDPDLIDAALARRLPDDEPFTGRAAQLEAAEKPADILAAAQSLDALVSRLQQGKSSE